MRTGSRCGRSRWLTDEYPLSVYMERVGKYQVKLLQACEARDVIHSLISQVVAALQSQAVQLCEGCEVLKYFACRPQDMNP